MEQHTNRFRRPHPHSAAPAPRPTHFVALRITDPTVVEATQRVQQELIRLAPHVRPWLHDTRRLHLTLFPLTLLDPDSIASALALLDAGGPIARKYFPEQVPAVRFEGVGQFNNRIVWMKPAEDDATAALMNMVVELEARYMAAGYAPKRNRDIVLHATLARPQDKFVPRHHLLSDELLAPLASHCFGANAFGELELCRMGTWAADGFYESLGKVSLAPTPV